MADLEFNDFQPDSGASRTILVATLVGGIADAAAVIPMGAIFTPKGKVKCFKPKK